MKIAFVGGGAIAKAIAHLAMEAGHEIVLGVRSPEKDDTVPFRRTTIETAVVGADLVMLAIPYGAAEEVLPSLAKQLSGSIVVDAITRWRTTGRLSRPAKTRLPPSGSRRCCRGRRS